MKKLLPLMFRASVLLAADSLPVFPVGTHVYVGTAYDYAGYLIQPEANMTVQAILPGPSVIRLTIRTAIRFSATINTISGRVATDAPNCSIIIPFRMDFISRRWGRINSCPGRLSAG